MITFSDENGQRLSDASILLKVYVQGAAILAGWIFKTNYRRKIYRGRFTSYCGRILAMLRAGYEAGEAILTVSGEGVGTKSVVINVGK